MLFKTPFGVVTVTKPLVAPVGTVAVRYVCETTWKVAAKPLNETAVVPVNPLAQDFNGRSNFSRSGNQPDKWVETDAE